MKQIRYFSRCFYETNEELNENLINQTADENKGQVLEEVMKLPEKYRIVIFLYYFEGYKISEIAQILEFSIYKTQKK